MSRPEDLSDAHVIFGTQGDVRAEARHEGRKSGG